MSNIGAAALAAGRQNKKRRMRQQYVQRTPNQPSSSRSFYPSSFSPNLHFPPSSVSSESYSVTSDGFPSLGASVSGGVYYQSMGRGPSPASGNSVLTLLNPSSGGRYAMGGVVNPRLPAFQTYSQTGSLPHQQQQYLSFSSPTAVPYQLSQPQTPPRAGTAVVVHEDGSRVVFHKGENSETLAGRSVES